MTAPLYRRLLGTRFDDLPERVRELHDVTTATVWSGRADVERGRSAAAQLLARLFSLPPEGRDQPIRVTFAPAQGAETWTRTFGAARFRSLQFERGGLLCERVAAGCLVFAPVATAEGLALELRGASLIGLALPAVLHPRVRTFESEREGRYRFDVEAHLPRLGLLVRYAGWLEREPGAPSA